MGTGKHVTFFFTDPQGFRSVPTQNVYPHFHFPLLFLHAEKKPVWYAFSLTIWIENLAEFNTYGTLNTCVVTGLAYLWIHNRPNSSQDALNKILLAFNFFSIWTECIWKEANVIFFLYKWYSKAGRNTLYGKRTFFLFG